MCNVKQTLYWKGRGVNMKSLIFKILCNRSIIDLFEFEDDTLDCNYDMEDFEEYEEMDENNILEDSSDLAYWEYLSEYLSY